MQPRESDRSHKYIVPINHLSSMTQAKTPANSTNLAAKMPTILEQPADRAVNASSLLVSDSFADRHIGARVPRKLRKC